jgi:transposase
MHKIDTVIPLKGGDGFELSKTPVPIEELLYQALRRLLIRHRAVKAYMDREVYGEIRELFGYTNEQLSDRECAALVAITITGGSRAEAAKLVETDFQYFCTLVNRMVSKGIDVPQGRNKNKRRKLKTMPQVATNVPEREAYEKVTHSGYAVITRSTKHNHESGVPSDGAE